MKDIRLRYGDVDLVTGKDIGMVSEKDAATTMVQTLIMGQDDEFDKKITDFLNRNSVRKLPPTEIAKLVEEEIEERIRENNVMGSYFISINVEVSDDKDQIKFNIQYKDKEELMTTLEWVGDIYDGGYRMEFSEPVKKRW